MPPFLLPIKGVIHIGANTGQEYEHYRNIGVEKQLWFEPLSNSFTRLANYIGRKANVIIERKAVGSKSGKVKLNIASNGQASSSILKPKEHLTYLPEVKFEGHEDCEMITLDEYKPTGYNALVIDVQGYELEVLKGANETLKHIDFIQLEVNFKEMYEGCVLFKDLNKYLVDKGFNLVYLYRYEGLHYGEAIYAKNLNTNN